MNEADYAKLSQKLAAEEMTKKGAKHLRERLHNLNKDIIAMVRTCPACMYPALHACSLHACFLHVPFMPHTCMYCYMHVLYMYVLHACALLHVT